jgi:hypothetical protein
MALIDQKMAGRQGNPNYVLYKLAALQATSPGNTTCNSNGTSLPAGTCTFNDVTKGNNSVACDAGFLNCSNQGSSGVGIMVEPSSPAPFTATTPAWTTTTGFDLATGLGSVNVTNLANNWALGTGAFTPTTTTIASPASGLTINHGVNQTFTINVTPTGATGDVSIIASPPGSPQVAISSLTLPNGVDSTLTAGTATFATNALPGGTSYPIIARYGGDGTFGPSDSAAITITVNKESSKVAATLQVEDPRSGAPTVTNTTPYGNNYLLRVDVTNAAGVQCSAVTFAIPCPTGTVNLTDGGAPLNDFIHAGGANSGTTTLNNQGFAEDAFLATNGLNAGSHSLSSTYAGDNSYTSSTQPTPNVVNITQAGINIGLTANGTTSATVTTGQPVTLTATATGFNLITDSLNNVDQVGSNGAGPTGTITFKNGSTTIATVSVVSTSFNQSGQAASATASTTATFSTAGTQNLTAVYSGDANYVSCSANSAVQPPCGVGTATVTVNASQTGSVAVSYSPQPLVLSSTSGAAATLTVTVTPTGGFLGVVAVTPTAASLPPGVTCTPSPLNINVTSAAAVAMPLMCAVTATSTALTASNAREDRMFEAKAVPPTNTTPPTGGKAWWTLSAGTGFAALFLIFLPGGRKKYRAALGLGLVCVLSFTLGCGGGGTTTPPPPPKTSTVTKMTVTNPSDKLPSGTAFTFSVSVTGGTPTGMVQLFDGTTALSGAGATAAVSGGAATLTAPTTLAVGTHSISVQYLGDSTTLASASHALNLTVSGSTTIAITTSPAATPAAPAINITVQ